MRDDTNDTSGTWWSAPGGAMVSWLSVASTIPPLQFGGGGFLYYALVFFVLAVVAALVGFRGVAGISMQVARIFVLLFLLLAALSLLL